MINQFLSAAQLIYSYGFSKADKNCSHSETKQLGDYKILNSTLLAI